MRGRVLGLFCLAMAAAESRAGSLSPTGENVCLVSESYFKEVTYGERVPVIKFQQKWCWSIPPTCTTPYTDYVYTTKTKQVPLRRVVPRCCTGYEEVENGTACSPVCSKGCVNGDCTAPEQCLCWSGYTGHSCSETCRQGFWGRDCRELCECVNNSTCNGQNGDCTCSPGWVGLRCEVPCHEGRFGLNCSEICDCDGRPCDAATGECVEVEEEWSVAEVEMSENVTESTTEEWSPTEESSTTESLSTTLETELNATMTTEIEFDSTESTTGEDPSDADNEIGDTEVLTSGPSKKFKLLNLLQNVSIVCGAFALITILTISSIVLRRYRKKREYTFKKGVNAAPSNRDSTVHSFYGGPTLPVKALPENHIYANELDLRTEQPKMMTFKPPPEEELNREYFMKSCSTGRCNIDGWPRYGSFEEEYYEVDTPRYGTLKSVSLTVDSSSARG